MIFAPQPVAFFYTPSMKNYAIIVAGGSGSRMNAEIPKQFLLLDGRPILMHTIEAFFNSEISPAIILVLNVDFHAYWEELCRQYNFTIPHTLVKAGSQRFLSVKNGLKVIKGNGIVAVHDAVRPLISSEIISRSFSEASAYGNAVTAIPSKDSVRQLSGDISTALNRNEIFLVQTPQTFEVGLLKKAYKQPYRIEFTDDASVVEKLGVPIHLVAGDSRNIKITFPEDLLLAELFFKDLKK